MEIETLRNQSQLSTWDGIFGPLLPNIDDDDDDDDFLRGNKHHS